MASAFLLGWANRFRKELATIGTLSLLGSLATLAVPWLVARLAGGVMGEAAGDLGQTLVMLCAALLVLTAMNIAVAIFSESASGRILAALRQEAYEHIVALPVGFHDGHRHGDVLALMSYEVSNLSTFLTATLAQVPAMLMTAGGAVLVLFAIDPGMALVVPVLVPLFYIGMKLLGRRLRQLGKEVRRAEVDVLWMAETDLDTLNAIKAFASEDHYRTRYLAAIEHARQLKLRQARITAFIGPIVALIAAFAAITILVAGNGSITAGERSPSELFAFLLYAALLTRPVGNLANTYGSYLTGPH
jgi:ATP-binding cassette subfamily B protein